jgi:Transposase IS116/IS110/IS902 family
VVRALQALRGTALVAAATLVAELGDITRFANPCQLTAYLGLVPSEHSSGAARRQGGITKSGNGAARRMLIEAAWSYRFPARISREQLLRQERLAKPIRDIGLIEARAYDSLDICGDLFELVRLLLADADAENNSPAPHPVAAEITGLAIERAELFVDLLFQVRARPTIRIL